MVVNANMKTICTICYDDLKPVIEDLQAISLCGHVFHELCLQQWFEYCTNEKKCSCPFCKQSCAAKDVVRLYLQSIGESNELVAPKKAEDVDDPVVLQNNVKRLESKVSGLIALLESQGKEIQNLNQEVHIFKEKLHDETTSRNDALEQKSSIQQNLFAKCQELDALKMEIGRLQDRNMALAKELAAVKLATNVNLEEDEIIKLASFGNHGNNKDTVDVLWKSLTIRNKSYKELMAKCNQLGRGEARSSRKLEKAKIRINKLKERVNKLETAIEAKENEALRASKLMTNTNAPEAIIFKTDEDKAKSTFVEGISSKEQSTNPTVHSDSLIPPDQIKTEIIDLEDDKTTSECALPSDFKRVSDSAAAPSGFSGSRPQPSSDEDAVLPCVSVDTTPLYNNGRDSLPFLNIKPRDSLPKPGGVCFSSGIPGPDGGFRYLGNWCRRGQDKGSFVTQNATTNSGDLIAVGADGRGGTIKVLRSLNHFSLDKEPSAKKCKLGTRSNNLQRHGCLQMEHFFGRDGR